MFFSRSECNAARSICSEGILSWGSTNRSVLSNIMPRLNVGKSMSAAHSCPCQVSLFSWHGACRIRMIKENTHRSPARQPRRQFHLPQPTSSDMSTAAPGHALLGELNTPQRFAEIFSEPLLHGCCWEQFLAFLLIVVEWLNQPLNC